MCKKGKSNREQVSLDKLAETSPAAIIKLDKEGKIVYANERAEEVLGLEGSKITGRSYDDPAWKITDFEGKDFPEDKLPFRRVKDTEEAVDNIRHAIEWPDGERKLLSVNASPLFDSNGNFDGMVSVIEDITDQVKTKEEIRQSKERYQEYFEKTGDAIFVVKMGGEDHGEILEVNSTAESQTGYSREELLDMNIVEDLQLEITDMSKKEANRKLERGETVRYTEKKKRKDGTEYWSEVVVTPLKHEGRRANLSINRDITERRKALEKLEKQKREKSILLKNLPGMAYKSDNDREWKMGFVSDGCEELTGYEPEELVGSSSVSYGELIVEEDREKVWEEVQKHLKEREPFKLEYRINTKTGELKWVWERGRGIFDENGQIKNLQGIVTDVTERKNVEVELKESEKKFRSYVENAPLGVILADQEGNYLEVNETACKMTGYSEEELLDMNVMDLHPPENIEAMREAMEKLHEKGEMSLDLPYRRKDGTEGHLLLNGVEIFENRILGFALDITERKEAEKKLERATFETLQALNRTIEAKDEYTGEHIDRVQRLSVKIGKEVGLSEERLKQLRYASILHDIGKIKVPDSILGKPAELTEDEWEEMKKHPRVGERIVSQVDQLKPAAEIVGQHQEKYDGSGYPAGLRGEEINLEARILAVADAWDAMRTDRPYREALPREEAIRELEENAGNQFDPEIVNIILEMLENDEMDLGLN